MPTTASAPTRRDRAPHLGPERRRPQVLDAALEIALAEGAAAVTIKSVAIKMGVTRPVVYACYPNRDDLIADLVTREERRLLESVLGALRSPLGSANPEDAFVGGLAAFLRTVAERRDAWRLLLTGEPDKELALACIRAWNDFVIEEWCDGSAGRLVPLGIVPLWDVDLATEEAKRLADLNFRSISFPEAPHVIGLPSIHSGHWDPFFTACQDTETVVCMHIGSSSRMPATSPDAPNAVAATLSFNNAMASMSDWLFSGKLVQFPRLKLAYSEGQIGWIPYILERADTVWLEHRAWGGVKDLVPEPPSTYYYRQIFCCFFRDKHGVASLDVVGRDNATFETDYPHVDSTFPHTKEVALEHVKGLDDEIKDLADTFDAMLERLDRSFDSQRRFVANASHELKTPVSTIIASSEADMARTTRWNAALMEHLLGDETYGAHNREVITGWIDKWNGYSIEACTAFSPVFENAPVIPATFETAMADVQKGNGEVGFDYGSTDYDSDTGLDSSDSLSIRGGYHMTNLFQVEGQYMTADATTEDLGVDVDASTDILMVNGVFNFHPKKEITPYVLVGMGRADVSVESTGVSADDSGMAYQIGAGSRFFFGKNKRTAFRVDLSRISQDTFDESTTNTTFAGGFTWRLGR